MGKASIRVPESVVAKLSHISMMIGEAPSLRTGFNSVDATANPTLEQNLNKK